MNHSIGRDDSRGDRDHQAMARTQTPLEPTSAELLPGHRGVFEDFGQHLGPRIIGHFGSLLILGLCVASKLKSFLFILSKDNIPSEWGVWGEDSPHLTR
jgi:hypothetical protein